MSLAKFLEKKNLKEKADLLRKELGQEEVVSVVVKEEIKTVEEVVPAVEKTIETPSAEVNIENMSKEELDVYAEKNYDVKLDRRKSKSAMVKDFFNKSKK